VDGHLSSLIAGSVAKALKSCFDGRYNLQQLHSGTHRPSRPITMFRMAASNLGITSWYQYAI